MSAHNKIYWPAHTLSSFCNGFPLKPDKCDINHFPRRIRPALLFNSFPARLLVVVAHRDVIRARFDDMMICTISQGPLITVRNQLGPANEMRAHREVHGV